MNSTNNISPVLEASGLTIGYRKPHGQRLVLLNNVNLEIQRGEVVCLLGPNGSGKSTLLRTLSGLQPPLGGAIRIMGKPVRSNQAKATARLLSVVLTEPLAIRDLTVRQLVTMGRYPYMNWLGTPDQDDLRIIERSIIQARMQGYEERNLYELSDGELQRAMVARALCQDTPLILLDEPTAHLDLPNRVSIMRLLKSLAAETGKSILFSSHELDLAMQTAGTLWLLRPGEPVSVGVPEDLVLNGIFESTFGADGVDFDPSTGNFRFHPNDGIPVFCDGNSVTGFWTRRALEREGFEASEDPSLPVRIQVFNGPNRWMLEAAGEQLHCQTLSDLLSKLHSLRSLTPLVFKKN